MIDPNRKRYVYLDKYIEQQALVMKRLNTHESRITALSILALGMITVMSLVLYKIFG
tara:strand:+ start:374 stop:544 length:171 start_codon:yes stop_codon:yes gene_type:complete